MTHDKNNRQTPEFADIEVQSRIERRALRSNWDLRNNQHAALGDLWISYREFANRLNQKKGVAE